MLNWNNEIDVRPMPTLLASAGMITVVIGDYTGFTVFYGLAGWCWVTSLQITIWRAVKALKDNE